MVTPPAVKNISPSALCKIISHPNPKPPPVHSLIPAYDHSYSREGGYFAAVLCILTQNSWTGNTHTVLRPSPTIRRPRKPCAVQANLPSRPSLFRRSILRLLHFTYTQQQRTILDITHARITVQTIEYKGRSTNLFVNRREESDGS